MAESATAKSLTDVILVLAWNLFDEILARLSDVINHRCIVITPLPKVKEVILNDKS